MPDPDAVAQRHCRVVPPDRQAGFTRFEYFRHLFAYREAARRLAPGALVLEIGSGEGYGAADLAQSVSRVVATDAFFEAASHGSRQYPRICFLQAGGTRLPFKSGIFDAVVSFQVIEHVADVRSYLEEVRRVLKPGAFFALTTPNRRLRLFPFQRPWNEYHVREYADAGISGLLGVFFNEVSMKGVMAPPALMLAEKRRVAKLRVSAACRSVAGSLARAFSALSAGKKRQGAADGAGEDGWGTPGEEDFYLSENTRDCLDFFIVSRKSGS